MRTLFIVLLVLMASTSAFGQTPPPPGGGSGGGKSPMSPIIVEPMLDNSNPRLDEQLTLTWQYNEVLGRDTTDRFRATISLVNGPEVSPIGTSITGGVESDGRRSHSFRLTSALVGDLTEPKDLKLRLVVGGHQVDLDLTVRPLNRKPVIDRVLAPRELVTGQDLAVDADWSEPDNDDCTFRVQRLVPETGQWHNVNGESDHLPMYVPIGELSESAMTTFRLVVTDSAGESTDRNFNVLLLPVPQALPLPDDPLPDEPLPDDPAPVASATVLTIELNPSSVRGGERFSLSWTITGPGAERSVVVIAQIQSQTGWGDLSVVGVEENTLSCVAPLSTSTTSMPVLVKLNVLEGGGTTIAAEATLTLEPNPPPAVDPAPRAHVPAAPARRSSGLREAVPLEPPPLNLEETDLMPELETVYDPDQRKYVLRRRVRGPSPAPAPTR